MNTLKSLAFVAAICGTIAAITWLGRNHEPLLSACDQRNRDAYPQLLGVSEALDAMALDDGEEWDRETLYQIWRLAVKANAAARGVEPRETRAHFEP